MSNVIRALRKVNLKSRDFNLAVKQSESSLDSILNCHKLSRDQLILTLALLATSTI